MGADYDKDQRWTGMDRFYSNSPIIYTARSVKTTTSSATTAKNDQQAV